MEVFRVYARRILRGKCGWMELAIAAFAVAAVGIFVSVSLLLESLLHSRRHYTPDGGLLWVNISVIPAAVHDGAVCLDGSPPAYHWHAGSGSGSKNWIVFLEGGAWCSDHETCAKRAQTRLGSSFYMETQLPFAGILSNSPAENPDFYNWNRVKVRYCDGASFAGNVEESVTMTIDRDKQGSVRQGQELTYRGQKVWKAVVSELLSKGMSNAEMALLAGCSAGGLAATLHCTSFKALLPQETRVKCMSDAGFFLDAKDLSGQFSFRSFFRDVVDLQNVRQNLPEDCVSKHDAKCFFPQYVLPHIQVPLFLVNPAYDVWQIQNILIPDEADPSGEWMTCKINPYTCSQDHLKVFQDFRSELLEAVSYERQANQSGFFVDSCFTHCQTEGASWNAVTIANQTIREAVGNWYFERSEKTWNSIDCSYPCNPTCIPWTHWRS